MLLSRYDVFLLDEPTNDLDFAGLERLEQFVLGLRAGLVVVSHDREFLARTITSVLDVDGPTRTATLYGGGYDAYLAERALRRSQAREAYEEFEDKRQGLVEQAQRQREQSVRGALRAKRKMPDNDRAAKGARIEAATHAASRVKGIESQLNRLDEVEEPRKEWQLQMEIAAAPRSGEVVAVLSRGRGAARRVRARARRPAGVVRRPAGARRPERLRARRRCCRRCSAGSRSSPAGSRSGRACASARSTRRARCSTGRPPSSRSSSSATEWPAADVRTLLAKYGLKADHVDRPASSLSPGERTRASLALLQAVGVNLLVLDEPTNHLDLPAIEQLEQALDAYEGTLLLVTHDRRLLEAVRVDRTVSL